LVKAANAEQKPQDT